MTFTILNSSSLIRCNMKKKRREKIYPWRRRGASGAEFCECQCWITYHWIHTTLTHCFLLIIIIATHCNEVLFEFRDVVVQQAITWHAFSVSECMCVCLCLLVQQQLQHFSVSDMLARASKRNEENIRCGYGNVLTHFSLSLSLVLLWLQQPATYSLDGNKLYCIYY